jgi:hypothetical protein
MILEAKETTIAYRCPYCGKTILGMVGIFTLSGDLIKLKCDCGQSEMTIAYQKDEKIRLTVPCFFCPRPHQYTLTPSVFFGRELFTLECAYSALDVCYIGQKDLVLKAAQEADKQLEALLKQAGVPNFRSLYEEEEEEIEYDPQIESIVALTIENLLEETKIDCNCALREEQEIHYEFLADSLLVYCKHCGATKMLPVSNMTTAMAFLETDRIDLRDQ